MKSLELSQIGEVSIMNLKFSSRIKQNRNFKITFTFETIFPDILRTMELLQRFAWFIGLITV